ncbi:MAG: hypothetical protein ABH821_03825 [archaeon]
MKTVKPFKFSERIHCNSLFFFFFKLLHLYKFVYIHICMKAQGSLFELLQKTLQKGVLHYPTLKTVLSVEKVLKNANNLLSREQIKEKLPTKIQHQTLNLIIEYLEESGKVFIGKKGVVWTHNKNPKFLKLLEQSTQVR